MKIYRFSINILFLLLFTSFAASANPPTNSETNPEEWTVKAKETGGTDGAKTESATTATPSFADVLAKILPNDKRSTGRLADGTNIYRKNIILKMYKENGFKPLWSSISILSLADAISVLQHDGLNPSDYQFAQISKFLKDPALKPQSREEEVTLDVLLTEAYLRALYNLNYGKVDPELLDADHNYTRKRQDESMVAQYLSWIQQGRVDTAFDWARPKNQRYQLLKSALAHYLQLQSNGGWPTIPEGKVIKLVKVEKRSEDPRIELLRLRLAAEGDLAYSPGQNIYDETLQSGVMAFQKRNHLKADGVVGPATLRVMNFPIEHRIAQIRADLDRERWYFPKDVDEYLLVDVADFKVYWMKQHQVFWESLVQVGKSYTTTPIFRDIIERIDFNPTWSIPPSIKKLNILPSLKIDSSYLAKKGYDLLDDRGRKVDARSIDWDEVSEMNYTVRQPPGRGNALGKVKFMFPNKHSVFLHDTNQRYKFAQEKRTTSHGCIRLKNPFDFAELLLQSKEGWDRERIDNLSASNRTTSIQLDKPLPILIQYKTVTVSGDKVIFREDIYKRDPKLIAELDKPFKLHLPDLPRSTRIALKSGVKSASRQSAKFLTANPEVIGGESVPDRASAPTIEVYRRGGRLYFD